MTTQLELSPPESENKVPTRSVMNGKPVFTVPSKTVLNLESGFKHKLLCDGPTFSTGTACAYTCTYCYVPDAMRKQGPWLQDHGLPANFDHTATVIRRENAVEILARQLETPKVRAISGRELTIYASPLVDVAANLDLVRETVECCKLILSKTRWHIRLLSKSNLLPKVAELLEERSSILRPRSRVIYGLSTGTLYDGLARALEPNVPLVSKRLAALHWLQDHGFRTFGMICPSLPTWQPGADAAAAYRHFAETCATALRAERCEHIWAEVINLRGESFTRTVAALRGAGYGALADETQRVSHDPAAWETYARATFNAHAAVYARLTPPGKTTRLRFLQYVTKTTREWWQTQQHDGAIML